MMATQAAMLAALRTAIASAGLAVAPSADPADLPSWALNKQVIVQVEGDETGGIGGGVQVDVTPIRLQLLMLTGNGWSAADGLSTSMTLARLLRVTGEALGDGIACSFVYQDTERRSVDGGLWVIAVRFLVFQSDTYP